ncbi:MAG: FAD-binding protein, partial [Treponemataceae bacterium]|nr:FAD-binding protein [Treponemataceae bacterium]
MADNEYAGLKNILRKNVLLSEKTTFKVGGPASYFAEPENLEQLQLLLRFSSKNQLPFFILGGGSNLVVADSGIDAIVISSEKLKGITASVSEEDEKKVLLCCGAGASIKSITEFCIENSYSGLENFAGLPGSCGGAAYMNARCFNVSFSEKILAVKYIDENFEEKTYRMNLDDWAYKKSPFQKMMASS